MLETRFATDDNDHKPKKFEKGKEYTIGEILFKSLNMLGAVKEVSLEQEYKVFDEEYEKKVVETNYNKKTNKKFGGGGNK